MDELRELYIEPTSHCNLQCVICSRNCWKNESKGHMDLALFDKVLGEIPDSVTRIFFGGFGEPLHHPDITYMLQRAKETGHHVEMITNGTLLDSDMSEKIIETNLDMLWISLDSFEEENYKEIRIGAEFKNVMNNIHVFNEKRFPRYSNFMDIDLDQANVKLCIAFVLMKKNFTQLKKLLLKARSLGISKVKVTHLIPYNKSQIDQICYEQVFGLGLYEESNNTNVSVDMPFLDIKDVQENDLLSFGSNPALSFSIMGTSLSRKLDHCRFIHDGITFVRWDGEVCPCMALLHNNIVYQQNMERHIRSCSYGNVNSQKLTEIWKNKNYSDFRQRIINFDFSFCTHCGPCNLFEKNEEDCYGNTFPTCGACLWAQGLFQCP